MLAIDFVSLMITAMMNREILVSSWCMTYHGKMWTMELQNNCYKQNTNSG